MLNFCFLESEGPFRVLGGQLQGIKHSSRVAAPLRVGSAVAEQFNSSHKNGVGNCELVDVEWQIKVDVLRLGILQRNGILPCDTSGCFGSQHAESAQHGPASVDQLALAEALQAKHFGVRGQGITRHLVGDARELADNLASLIHGCVLVELVEVNLEVFGGLGEAEGVEASVAGEGSVQPIRTGGVGEPQGFACKRMIYGILNAKKRNYINALSRNAFSTALIGLPKPVGVRPRFGDSMAESYSTPPKRYSLSNKTHQMKSSYGEERPS